MDGVAIMTPRASLLVNRNRPFDPERNEADAEARDWRRRLRVAIIVGRHASSTARRLSN